MARSASKGGRGSPAVSLNPPKTRQARSTCKPYCLQCAGTRTKRLRVVDNIYLPRVFCSRQCACLFALDQLDRHGYAFCPECKT